MNHKNHKPYVYKKKKKNGKSKVGREEKYTPKFVTDELQAMIDYMNSEDGSDVIFISELCLHRGYSPQRWSEIANKYADNENISETIKRIESILEIRLYKAGLTGAVNPTMALAGLNNKYKWINGKQLNENVNANVNMNTDKTKIKWGDKEITL